MEATPSEGNQALKPRKLQSVDEVIGHNLTFLIHQVTLLDWVNKFTIRKRGRLTHYVYYIGRKESGMPQVHIEASRWIIWVSIIFCLYPAFLGLGFEARVDMHATRETLFSFLGESNFTLKFPGFLPGVDPVP